MPLRDHWYYLSLWTWQSKQRSALNSQLQFKCFILTPYTDVNVHLVNIKHNEHDKDDMTIIAGHDIHVMLIISIFCVEHDRVSYSSCPTLVMNMILGYHVHQHFSFEIVLDIYLKCFNKNDKDNTVHRHPHLVHILSILRSVEHYRSVLFTYVNSCNDQEMYMMFINT